jgi:flavin reductase (DIM6/NTAB) family NADH-FMN oxidoreductase RutF
MSFDVKTFRRALGCFATGITVVTAAAGDGGEPFGVTINSFTSVSLEPPLVLFCLGRASRLYQGFTATRTFAVNVLADDQAPLSMHFATPDSQRRWTGVAAHYHDDGTPVLAGGLAHLYCTTEAIHDGGDHVIVVGRVRSLDWREGHPLLYVRGRYGRLGELFVPLAAPADVPATAAAAVVETVSGDAVASALRVPSSI